MVMAVQGLMVDPEKDRKSTGLARFIFKERHLHLHSYAHVFHPVLNSQAHIQPDHVHMIDMEALQVDQEPL